MGLVYHKISLYKQCLNFIHFLFILSRLQSYTLGTFFSRFQTMLMQNRTTFLTNNSETIKWKQNIIIRTYLTDVSVPPTNLAILVYVFLQIIHNALQRIR